MGKGIDIFLHSARLVLGDWRNALRITGLLYLIYAVPSLVLNLLYPPPAEPEAAMEALLAAGPASLISLILAVVAFVWIAVAWHRYILLDEAPAGQLPAFNRDRMLAYAGYSILLGLIGLLLSFLVSAVVGIVLIPLLGGVGVTVTGVLGFAAVLIVAYRLGPMLPAAATGRALTIRQAWEATDGANGPIIVLAIVSAIAAIAIDLPALGLASIGTIGQFLGLLWTLATGWLKMLVGISALTTLYGHYVEGRAIPKG